MTQVIADLHIHSRYSRATARNLDPENLWVAAQLKGIDILGSGDLTHPAWLDELEEKLVPGDDGLYGLKPELAAALGSRVPAACRGEVRFVLSGEISSIYKRHGQTRKVHNIIILPDIAAARRLQERLDRLGNITSDGRPILGLDSRDLLEIALEASDQTIFIPAHIWTPWFSLFGSKSGFDTIEECFGDLTGHIHALETGLSSDPPMNWRLSQLDRFVLVSHSDAHSPAKLAREADLLEGPVDYASLHRALAQPGGEGFLGTIEFFPDEGKYHLDGHRKCGVRLTPAETRAHHDLCPVCGKPVTRGVLGRVDEMADRPDGVHPPNARSFESLVPLNEVMGEVLDRGPATKGVTALVNKLTAEIGPELYVLRRAELERIAATAGDLAAEAVGRVRRGEVFTQGGYDGEYGVVTVFKPGERAKLAGQERFWGLGPAGPDKKPSAPSPSRAAETRPAPTEPSPLRLSPLDPATHGLNDQQAAAVDHRGGHLLVQAGPGSGKTRVLVSRAAALLRQGVDPDAILAVTFTRKAAGEMRRRLAELHPRASALRVGTFHSLGREIITQAWGADPQILDEEGKLEIIRPLAKDANWRPGRLADALSYAKQRLEAPQGGEIPGLLQIYQAELKARRLLDLDDLVRQAAMLLQANEPLRSQWRGRFAHILVDEYQDVNPVQVNLLKALTGEQTQVMAIGDPDQAIYGFRGAERALFARFGSDFPQARVLGLTQGYRNSGPILRAAQRLIRADRQGGGLRLIPARPDGPLPVTASLPSPQSEASWVAERMLALMGGLDSRQVETGVEGEGYSARDMAVLYRLHAQAPPLAEALTRAGIPFQTASKQPLAETDPLDFRAQRVSLLSLHAAKGLEFPVVFIVGLEEKLLPYEPPEKDPADVGEERRLLYVGMTRAEQRLYLTRANKRSLYGNTYHPGPSPFWRDLPSDEVVSEKAAPRAKKARQLGLFG